MILTQEHLHAASKHERWLILQWLTDVGADVAFVASFDIQGDTVAVTELAHDADGTLYRLGGMYELTVTSYPVGDSCPLPTIAVLFDRVGPAVTEADERRADALAEAAERYRDES